MKKQVFEILQDLLIHVLKECGDGWAAWKTKFNLKELLPIIVEFNQLNYNFKILEKENFISLSFEQEHILICNENHVFNKEFYEYIRED